MKPITKFFIAAMLLIICSFTFAKAQQTSPANVADSTDRHLSGFSKLKIAGPFDVYITQGGTESVRIEATPDVKDRIMAEVDGSTLKIRQKHDNWGKGPNSWYSEKSVWHNHKKIMVYITAKELTGISISGSGHITFNDGITTNDLKLRVRGSGLLQGKIDVKKLKSKISGSGQMKLNGIAENSAVQISGSGNFTAKALMTEKSAIRVSGSGHAEVNASNQVDAVAHGSAAINYTGTAKIVNSSKSGSGEITRF